MFRLIVIYARRDAKMSAGAQRKGEDTLPQACLPAPVPVPVAVPAPVPVPGRPAPEPRPAPRAAAGRTAAAVPAAAVRPPRSPWVFKRSCHYCTSCCGALLCPQVYNMGRGCVWFARRYAGRVCLRRRG